jgi:uncharacterized membrane protein
MDEITLWNKILKGAMELPLVKVDRAAFLKKELMLYCNPEDLEKVVSTSPVHFVDKKIVNKIANGCINFHLTSVTATSALAGIPGGLAMFGTVPADITQFYGHIFCLAQKLMYLYGWPDLTNEEGDLDDETVHILTLFTGVMFGEQMANQALKALEKELAKQFVKRLPRVALTKYSIYNIVKQVAKWIGIKITKDSFAKNVGKLVPIVGAPISGGMTYWTFKPMARRLKKHLDESWELRKAAI